ncbi:helix-turn-helix domain-containing protein [Sinomicrobium kalidii]|uniref:helix-turn-helix domain-containing protein n=1 Tax=Sinomicrobium kalidii TaxID=2900738 RepID=UPI001E47C2A5|nr:helix-turn-helix domain-containing protein [Sinomicrobium kalidii]UGU14444.1 helix-turn-helix domain-containing protein [Sinomicrobium kalidii]
MCRFIVISFIFVLLNDSLHGQTDAFIQQLDSLKHYTYKDLSTKFYDHEADSSVAVVYANTYLYRAKKDKDTIKMVDGYFFMTEINRDSIAIKYSDSIINLTQNIKGDKYYPFYGYLTRANLFFTKRKFKNALDDYLRANEHLNQWEESYLDYVVKHNIGLLKSRMGEYEEAMTIFKRCLNFYQEPEHKNKYNSSYLSVLVALSDTHMRLQSFDSASMINRIGYDKSVLLDMDDQKGYFIIYEGANQYFKGNYNAAIDSIVYGMPIIRKIGDQPNLAFSYFYLGKSYLGLKRTKEAVVYFKKVDTIFQNLSDIHPEMREGYEILINHYKSIGDKEQQLLYTEKLLTVDSVLNDNYRYINKNIIHQYDTPQLISQKDELIAALDGKKRKTTIGIISISILALGTTGLFFYYYRKQRIYKKRLEKLLREKIPVQSIPSASEIKDKVKTDVPKEIVNTILKNLEQFEAGQGYLSRNLNLKDMAKDLQTNNKYLSKTINLYKQKTFNTYINDLRVDYAVSRLKTDQKFRNYTITAIARESGFNSQEPFSKAFYKKTGIYPSYLIKELDKRRF